MSEQNSNDTSNTADDAQEESDANDEQQTPADDAGDAPNDESDESPEDKGDADLEEIPEEDAWDRERALAKIRKLNAEVKATKEKVTKTDSETKETKATNESLTVENLRLRVGYETGLPIAMVDRLKGSTREELLADAEELLGMLAPTDSTKPPSKRPAEQLRGGGGPEQEPEETDPDKIAQRMFAR